MLVMVSYFKTGFKALIFLAFIQPNISGTFCSSKMSVHALTVNCSISRIIKSILGTVPFSTLILSDLTDLRQTRTMHFMYSNGHHKPPPRQHWRAWCPWATPRGAASAGDRTNVLGDNRDFSIFSGEDSVQRD